VTSYFEGLLEKSHQLPSEPGVYIMKDEKGLPLYVGKAISLKNRVPTYFNQSGKHRPKIQIMLGKVRDFDFILCDSEVEALLKEARMIKDLRPPYNTMMTDSKSFPYIEITMKDDFPLVRVSRENHVKGNIYYGPFAKAGALKPCLSMLQKIFRFRTCELIIEEDSPKNRHFSPCLLHHIGRCTAPCANRVNSSSYSNDIRSLRKVLDGKTFELRKELKNKMHQASSDLEYEKASVYRDRMKALEGLKTAGLLGSQPELEIAPVNAHEGMAQLAEVLHLEFVPRSIEGFDIAHLQGNQTVASMVSFIDGKPFKEGYRRFKIKTVDDGDDFAAMEEVLQRRYSRLKEEGQPFPHLVLIDGGKGQLGRAIKVFENLGMTDQKILSLAKKEEKIFVPHRKNAIVLSRQNTALRVLQHVRDESHRFAQHYHHLLRDKNFLGNHDEHH